MTKWKCFLLVLLIHISFVQQFLCAQLPPTLNRISTIDSAVDIPEITSTEFFVDSFTPSINPAYEPKKTSFIVPSDEAFNARPFSVEFWTKVNSKDTFQIFLANEEKSSPRHWELYTFVDTGQLSLYVPGNVSEKTIKSNYNLVDGKVHHIGLVMDVAEARLYVDNKLVGRGVLDLPSTSTPSEALFAIGSLVEKGLYCDAIIDELCISKGTRDFESAKSDLVPVTADENTLLLTHFEPTIDWNELVNKRNDFKKSLETTVPNQEALKVERFPQIPKYFQATRDPDAANQTMSYAELGLDQLTQLGIKIEGSLADKLRNSFSLPTISFDHLFPTGGLEIKVAPGEKPKKNIPIQTLDRKLFVERINELKINSFVADDFRDGVLANWGEQFLDIEKELSGERKTPRGASEQVLDENSLVFPEKETLPLQVILRRTKVLIESGNFDETSENLSNIINEFQRFDNTISDIVKNDSSYLSNKGLTVIDYFIACAFRRAIMFAQDELSDLDRIMFLARGCYAGSRLTNQFNTDRIGGHMSTQVYGFNTIHGGGIFALQDWKKKFPKVVDLIAGKKVVATPIHKRLEGRELDNGAFYKPELSYDGKTIYFSWCNSQEHRWLWTPETTWSIFKTSVDGNEIEQLTDGAYNDFDVCELPSGRLVFCSERRGGFIRCFGEGASLRVTTSVMHSMKKDGSDIYPISYFETSEWRPTVDNNGALVYSRWDYTDRENCLGSTFWTCAPDGRNPRSPQGNYPYPWDTFEDCQHGDHRFGNCADAPSGLPMTQMQFRPIPGSHKYIFTAAPHHGESFGSLCLLDLRIPNDNHMSQIKRITPYEAFPESEMVDRSQYRYGAPWALSEDLYLCNSWEDLVLLDKYGNEELLCEREILPIGYDPRLRLTEPIPLRARPVPPIVAQQTAQGEDFSNLETTATIGVVNVNIHDRPFPENRPVKRLRVLQVIPKSNPWMDKPFIGYATENTPRIPLGTVPVEEDGSVYFEAPYGKQLIFQLLDENNMAIQTMRAVAFVHPGEKLVCIGCHEETTESISNTEESSQPLAFQHKPAKLEPECGTVEPINFYRLIKPIIEEKCISCHKEKQLGLQSMDYEDLRPYVYYYSGSMRGGLTTTGTHGGSRARPGRVGASESKLSKILFDENHKEAVSEADRHAFILWLDANALRLGAFQDEEAQMRGELVWPLLDVESCDLYTPN